MIVQKLHPAFGRIKNKIKIYNMFEFYKDSKLYQLFTEILLPAFLAVVVKVSVEKKVGKGKLTFVNTMLSFVIGCVTAYITGGWISSHFDEDITRIIIALLAMSSEKIVTYIVFKLDIDLIMATIFQDLLNYISNFTKIKKDQKYGNK